jgi:uncharacterized protein (DUF2235 family)
VPPVEVRRAQPGWLASLMVPTNLSGLYENILEAYSFVCHNYNSNDDEIYLLGFSRGAFTARCIAQFICEVGLLTKAGLFDMLDLFSLWKKRAYVKLGSKCSVLEIGGRLRPGIAIHACAVWDTVSSFGLPMVAGLPQLGPARLEFVNSNLCPGIRKAFQALSLHEHRRSFHPIVWKLPGKDDERLKQCWFLGYHSDIGGGNEKEGLAHLPLVWIISQIKDFLCFNREDLWSSPGIGWRLSDALKKPGCKHLLDI